MSTEISSPFDVDIAITSAVSEAAEAVEAARQRLTKAKGNTYKMHDALLPLAVAEGRLEIASATASRAGVAKRFPAALKAAQKGDWAATKTAMEAEARSQA